MKIILQNFPVLSLCVHTPYSKLQNTKDKEIIKRVRKKKDVSFKEWWLDWQQLSEQKHLENSQTFFRKWLCLLFLSFSSGNLIRHVLNFSLSFLWILNFYSYILYLCISCCILDIFFKCMIVYEFFFTYIINF